MGRICLIDKANSTEMIDMCKGKPMELREECPGYGEK